MRERSYYTEYLLVDNGWGHITSPNYPCNYQNNANFTWIIKAKRDQINVNFTILDLQAETSGRGCYDYLKVCLLLYNMLIDFRGWGFFFVFVDCLKIFFNISNLICSVLSLDQRCFKIPFCNTTVTQQFLNWK